MTTKLVLPFASRPLAFAFVSSLNGTLGYPRVPQDANRHGTGRFVPHAAAATTSALAIIPKAYTGVWGVVVDGDEVRACAARFGHAVPFTLLTALQQAACVPVDASWYPDGPAPAG